MAVVGVEQLLQNGEQWRTPTRVRATDPRGLSRNRQSEGQPSKSEAGADAAPARAALQTRFNNATGRPRWPGSNQPASGKPGAVQFLWARRFGNRTEKVAAFPVGRMNVPPI